MKKIIYCVTDGKIGHVRQTEGLALALQSIQDCEIQWVPTFSVLDLLKNRGKIKQEIVPNSIVIGAGHSTHLALLYYKMCHQAKAIVIMKPSFPKRWFDFCIVPQHDRVPERDNVLVTIGAMNALSLKTVDKKKQVIILIGGPSPYCQWSNATIYNQIEGLLARDSDDNELLLTTSRRTPEDFLKELPDNIKQRVKLVDFKAIDATWLPQALLESTEAWVTAESISMVYESLSAGCQVHIMDVEGLSGKIAENLQFLRDNNKVDLQINTGFRLNESYRIAQQLINLGLFDETTIDTN